MSVLSPRSLQPRLRSSDERCERPGVGVDELRASQERYRALVELSPDAIAVIQGGIFVFANQRALDLFGANDFAQLQARPAIDYVQPQVRGALVTRYRRLAPGSQLPYVSGFLIRLDDQRTIPIETAAAGIEYEGQPAVMLVVRDTIARQENEQAMWAAEQRFAAAFHEAPIAMLLIDPTGTVLDANPALGDLVDDDPRAMVGRESLHLVHPEDRDDVRELLRSVAEKDRVSPPMEWRLEQSDGSIVWVQGSVAPLPGEPKMLVLHLIDITDRRATEARLAHRALHDPLTSLPNRTLLIDRLAQAVRAAQRDQGPGVSVLYLDLNDFKLINDTYGHATGDQVLIEVARRLRAAVRPADTVARLGGDEYAVVAEALPPADAVALAQRLRDALEPPIGDLFVVAAVGTAHSSKAGLDADALLRHADADMYQEKPRGRRAHAPAQLRRSREEDQPRVD
jgi:diguanylate cyclase (GGDEF)-like protein/PAS domain S-box-containing protein